MWGIAILIQLNQMKSDKIDELVKAIIQVMGKVKNIEKTMTVGSGNNAYKAVSDKDVKLAVGQAMEDAGLALVPIDVQPTTRIERWEEADYQSKIKTKQNVFTEVKVDYLLMHTSGQFIHVQGYGHGTDPQDKSAGKATTYAMKYLLLYMFIVPTGSIPDSDVPTPPVNMKPLPKEVEKTAPADLKELMEGSPQWSTIENYILDNPSKALDTIINGYKKKVNINADLESKLRALRPTATPNQVQTPNE